MIFVGPWTVHGCTVHGWKVILCGWQQKKKKLKRALQQRWTQQTRIQTAPKRKNEPQYKPLTSFTATPPRFFSELKGKTCRIIDSDLARSKFIPNCSTNWIQKWTSNIKLLKNNNNKKFKNLKKKKLHERLKLWLAKF